MSLLDLLVLVLVGISTVAGFVAGFARVGVGFLAAIGGLLFGFWFYGFPAAVFHTFIKSQTASNLLGFFLVFFGFVFAGMLVGKLLAKLFKWTGLSWLDRLIGGLFGVVRGALVSLVFITAIMAFTPNPKPNWMVDSKVLPYAMEASDVLSSLAPSSIKQAFRESVREIRKAWDDELRRARNKIEMRKSAPKETPEPKQEPKKPEPRKQGKAKEKSRVGQTFDF